MDRRALAAPAAEVSVTPVLELHPHLIRAVVDQQHLVSAQPGTRRARPRGRAVRRLLTGTMVAGGALLAANLHAEAATTATFSNGVLTVFGDGAANTLTVSRERPAGSWSTGVRCPSPAARRPSPTPASSSSSARAATTRSR